MSLNEDCLLGYLRNSKELFINTEFLKSCNESFEKDFVIKNVSNKINIISFKTSEVLS